MYRNLLKLTMSAFFLSTVASCGHNGTPDMIIEVDGGGTDLLAAPDLSQAGDMTATGDLMAGGDMSTQSDLARPADLLTQPDLTMGTDMMTGSDMTMGGDMMTGPDMAMGGDMKTGPDMAMGMDMAMMHDMGGMCDGAIPHGPDLMVAPTGMTIDPKHVGATCKATADCTQGTAPVCWTDTLFNMTGLLPVPGGYCSSTCTTDSDCGTNNLCIDFGGMLGKACIAGCADAVTCRHPDYSCTFLGVSGAGMVTAGCFPNANLTCNPEDTTPCTDFMGGNGGCVRQAIEDQNGGICFTLCQPGDTCAMDAFGETTACLELDFTPGGDAFRGTLCYPNATTPKNPGDACMLENDCIDGYECDVRMGGTGKCQKLCSLGKATPACPMGTTCQNVFGLCGGAGLCE